MKHTVELIKLSTGAEGLLVNIPGSTVLDMEFAFLSGFEFASSDKYEIPHSMEHMIFGANSQFNSGQKFSREIGLNGAYHNAYTSQHLNGYLAEAPEFEWQRVMELLWTGLTSPKFLPSEFKTEQGTVSEELHSMLDNHEANLDIALSRAMGNDKQLDYATRISQLDSMTPTDLWTHHTQTHTAQNLRFIVAGNLKGKIRQITNLLNTASKKLPSGTRLTLSRAKLMKPAGPTTIKRDADKIYFNFNAATHGELSERQLVSLLILRHILVRAWDSRIFGQGRTKGLLYGVHGSIGSVAGTSWFDISGSVAPAKAKALMEFIASELIKLRQKGITAAELKRAKQYQLGKFQLAHQTPQNIANWYSRLFIFGDYYSFTKRPALIQSITKHDVESLIPNFFSDESFWGVGVLGRDVESSADVIYKQGVRIWG